jgi:hypothetical protein
MAGLSLLSLIAVLIAMFWLDQVSLTFLVTVPVLGIVMAGCLAIRKKRARLTAGYLALIQLADLSSSPMLQRPDRGAQSSVKKSLYAFNPADIFNFLGKRHKSSVKNLLEHRMPKPAS